MATKNLVDLVNGAFPPGFDGTILQKYGKPEWWRSRHRLALAYSLRKCPYLDWEAYLNENTDVKNFGIDPVIHFLWDGVFEGRKLFIHNTAIESDYGFKSEMPAMTVAIANYNNAAFLEKALDSVCAQTMNNLEILVVDDASIDESRTILESYATRDSRIRLIFLEKNSGLHIVRIRQVAEARGRFMMFLDSDDYYLPDACEKVYKYALNGYDIVSFGINVIGSPGVPSTKVVETENYLNRGEAKEYRGGEVYEAIFSGATPSKRLWSAGYKTSLLKYAFALMDTTEFRAGEDVYEMAVILPLAQSLLKTNDKLCVYRLGSGQSTSTNPDTFTKSVLNATDILPALKQYMNDAGTIQYWPFLSWAIIDRAVCAFCESMPPDLVTDFFNRLTHNAGLEELVTAMMHKADNSFTQMAENFSHYQRGVCTQDKIQTVGILHHIIADGGTTKVIVAQARVLTEAGYHVIVFINHAHQNDVELLKWARVVYYENVRTGLETTGCILRAFSNVIAQNHIDIMLCHATFNRDLLWHLMILKYKGIPTIGYAHEAFYNRLLYPDSPFNNEERLSLMRCLDKLAVLSKSDEIYYRALGVDAQRVSNPVDLPDSNFNYNYNFQSRKSNLVTFCRLGDPTKRVTDVLDILALLVKESQAFTLTFIGSFRDKKSRNWFYARVRELALERNVRVTGWIDMKAAEKILNESALLISTAYHEAFPLTISEALSRGVPVVMYDLPITIAENNPAVTRINHGDIDAVAETVIDLLGCEEKWRTLSLQAMRFMQQFSPSNYVKELIWLMSNTEKMSMLNRYDNSDYEIDLRSLAFYAAHMPPWIK